MDERPNPTLVQDLRYAQKTRLRAELFHRFPHDLRTIVEKVEQKAHVSPDNPDVVALRRIVETKITELETEENSNPFPPPNAA